MKRQKLLRHLDFFLEKTYKIKGVASKIANIDQRLSDVAWQTESSIRLENIIILSAILKHALTRNSKQTVKTDPYKTILAAFFLTLSYAGAEIAYPPKLFFDDDHECVWKIIIDLSLTCSRLLLNLHRHKEQFLKAKAKFFLPHP